MSIVADSDVLIDFLRGNESCDEILPWANSDLGHFGHADSHRLRERFCKTIITVRLGPKSLSGLVRNTHA